MIPALIFTIGAIFILGIVAGNQGGMVYKLGVNKHPMEERIIMDVIPSSIPAPTLPVKYVLNPTTDPDPLIHCSIHSNCGGGVKTIRKSECDQSTCCERNGQWIFYTDKARCANDQRGDTQAKIIRDEINAKNTSDCVNDATTSKETCYKNCSFWYSLGDNIQGEKCITGCYDIYEMALDACY